MPDQTAIPGATMQTVWSDMDMRITFTGNGYALFKVFDLDISKVECEIASYGKKNWALAFEGIPEDALILVRAHGHDPVIRFGFNSYLNGQLCATYVNAPYDDEDFLRYRDLASRVMWLFDDDCGTLTVDAAHAMYDGTGARSTCTRPRARRQRAA